MKDNEVGKKKVKLIANVYRISDNEKLASEEFFLIYERKQMPNHIVTSVDCYINDNYGHSKSVFYLTPSTFPCSVDVYIDNGRRTIQCRQGNWTDLVSKPSIKMTHWSSYMTEYNYSEYSRCFIWNESGLSVFTRDFQPQKAVAIPHVHSTDPSTAIANLKSKSITQFVSAFSDISLVILSANNNDKQEILSVLNSFTNDQILPSIKEAAESVFNAIFSGQSSLQWNSMINTLNTQVNEFDKREIEGSKVVHEEAYTISSNVDTDLQSETDNKKTSISFGKLSVATKNKIGKRVQVIMINEGVNNTANEANEEGENEGKPNELKESEEYKSVNYQAYLETVKKLKMDEIFQMVYKRRTTNKYV